MKSVLFAVAGLAVAASLALPAAAAGQTPTGDSVVGSARDCQLPDPCPTDPSVPTFFTSLTADARSSAAGQDPAGTMTGEVVTLGTLFGHWVDEARVTCLSVTGDVAIIGVAGTRTYTRINFTVWIAGLIRVTDGGPGSGQDTFESDIVQPPAGQPPPPPPPDPTDCSSFPAGKTVFHNEEGDLVVHDAPPLPTSKEQCKNGGWRTFDVFKNQGDCVSYVATGYRNPPDGSP